MAETMRVMVRGARGGAPYMPSGAGDEKISRMLFERLIPEFLKAYRDPPAEEVLLACFVETIGKDGDSKLLFNSLKNRAKDQFHELAAFGLRTNVPFLEMSTAEDVTKAIFDLRMGTLPHIKMQKCFLEGFASKLRGHIFIPNQEARDLMLRMLHSHIKVESRSMEREAIEKELARAGEDGEIIIVQSGKVEEVKFNRLLHRAYVAWLVRDVYPTLDPNDARKGSMGEWNKILNWEAELTSSIRITPERATLDVSSEFNIYPWLDGFLSFDLSLLEDAPGFDTDRRILRLFLFVEWAFAAAISAVDKISDKSGHPTDSAEFNQTNTAQEVDSDDELLPNLLKGLKTEPK